jgi:hypothetical protein
VATVNSHEVSAVLEEDLEGVAGAKEATAALLHFHVYAKALLIAKKLRVPKTYTISFRTLQHAARMCRRYRTWTSWGGGCVGGLWVGGGGWVDGGPQYGLGRMRD